MSEYTEITAKAKRAIDEISEHTGTDINPDTFCILPFIHVSTLPQGEVKLCCRGQPPKNIVDGYDTYNGNPHVQFNDFDLEEYWNSDYMNGVRKNLIEGRRISQCKNCWKMEDQNILSLRHNRLIDSKGKTKHYDAVKSFTDTGSVPFDIPIIELKLSNLCNFKCRMCWPKDSSLWATDWEKVEQFYDDETREYINNVAEVAGNKRLYNMFETNKRFVDKLLVCLENVEEIEFAGGEPLLDPIHYRVLSNIKHPERVTLKYSTNLHQLGLGEHDVIELWKRFAGVKITISIDGDRELNARIRRNSDWDILKANIERCKSELDNNLVQIKGTTCISAHNVLYLDRTAEAIIEDLGIQWHTSRLQYPEFQHANVVNPIQLQEALERMYASRDRIAERSERKTRFNVLHMENAINWIKMCIKNNQYGEKYDRFEAFNKTLDASSG